MALARVAIAWAVGLVIGPVVGLPTQAWLLQATASAGFALVFRRIQGYARLFAALTIVCLGAARSVAFGPGAEPSTLTAFNDLPVLLQIQGVVMTPPVTQGRTTRAHVRAQAVRRLGSEGWREIGGLVQVETTEAIGLRYGDRLVATGWLSTPVDTLAFARGDYLEGQGVFSLLRAVGIERLAEGEANPILGWIYLLRTRALEVFAASLPGEEAALVAGVVLGADESMPARMREVFARTGTTHILAVSGFNVALVAGTVTAVFGRWLGARRGAVAAAAAIATYTLLVGAEPSAVRAAVMAGLALLARMLGRQGDAATSLAATGILMTAFEPGLLADIGFQLSFAATLGLVFVADPLEVMLVHTAGSGQAARSRRPAAAILREVVLMTLAAQVATLPLLAYHFGRLPLTALPANFLILPVQPALMSLGGLTALAGMVWAPAGQLFAWLTWPFAAFTLRAVEVAAHLPGASLNLGPVSAGTALAGYGALVAGLAVESRLRSKPGHFVSAVSPWAALVALGVVAAFVWRQGLDEPDGNLSASLFPSGDVLIESPGGRFVLVRPPSLRMLPAGDLGRRVPLTGSALDWLVLPSGDSVDGYVAGRPSDALIPGGIVYARSAPNLSQLAGPRYMPEIVPVYPGLQMDLGEGAYLRLLSLTDQGAAMIVSMGRARILLLEGLPLDSISAADRAGAVVVLADSFARLSSIPAQRWTPWLIAYAGDSLDLAGTDRAYPTAQYGWIEVRTDGNLLWLEVEKPGRTSAAEPGAGFR